MEGITMEKLLRITWKAVFVLILITVLLMTFACGSQKDKAYNYYQKNKGELAELCETEFPSKDIEYIEGETKVKTDTIYSETQIEIPCPEPTDENPRPSVKCPPEKIIEREIFRTDTIRVEHTQRIRALQSIIKKSEDDREELEKELSTLKKWRTYLIAFVIALILFAILRR